MSTMCPATAKKPTAFVMMPFAEEFTDVYEELIRTALDGYEVYRADSRLDERNILEKIVRGIEDADLVIADLTTLNANVMYELGVAHALGKPTVMITQTLLNLPFDVRSYPAHLYSTYFKRAREFTTQLQEIATRHQQGLLEFGNPVSDYRSSRIDATQIPARSEVVHRLPSAADETGLTLDEATREFGDLFKLLSAETNLLATHLTESAAEVNRARESRFGVDRIPVIHRGTAAHISAYARAISAQQSRLHDTWRRFGNGMLQEVQRATGKSGDPTAARAAILELDSSIATAIEHALAFRAAIANLPVSAPSLVEACDEAQAAIDDVLNELALGKAYIQRVRELLHSDAFGSA